MPGEDDGSITRWIAGVKAGDLGSGAAALGAVLRADGGSGAGAAPGIAMPGRRQRRGRCGLERLRQPLCGACGGGGSPNSPIATTCGGSWWSSPRGRSAPWPAASSGRNAVAGRVQPASDHPDPDSDDDILARAVGSEPTPEFAVMVAEEYRRLLDRLGDDVLRKSPSSAWRGSRPTRSPSSSAAPAAPSRGNWR